MRWSIDRCSLYFYLSLAHARARTQNRTKNSQTKLKWQIDGEGEGRMEGSSEGNILEERRRTHPSAAAAEGREALFPFKFNSRKFICIAAVSLSPP